MHILFTVPEPATPRAYRLNPAFANSLRQALQGSGPSGAFGLLCDDGAAAQTVTMAELDAWARGQWEAILYFMVGSVGAALNSKAGARATSSMKKILEMGNFVSVRGGRVNITKQGFAFLLDEANTQVWTLLIVYLGSAESVRIPDSTLCSLMVTQLQMDPVEMLSFLFMLGSLEFGKAYSTKRLTDTQKHMLDDLNDFGIVSRVSSDPSRFYPTRLATTLTSSETMSILSDVSSITSMRGNGYIVLETNHRIYAYTSSPLQVAVLNLFVKLTGRQANFIAGKLTKDSVQRAISYGITADQIISYLASNAHGQLRRNKTILPPTVVDQIRLWQIEGDRMLATPGYLLKQFPGQKDYKEMVDYAEALGVLVWRNDEELCFFASSVEQLSAYMQKKAANNAAK
jgi:transcription initiation factor TFIIH subunit 4